MNKYSPYWLLRLLLGLLLSAAAPDLRAQPLTFGRALTCGSGSDPYGMNWGPTAQVLDAQGNLYVLGTFNGIIAIGNTLLSATQPYGQELVASDAFVAKLNPAGQYEWAMQLGNNATQNAYGSRLAVDALGNVYVTGSFSSYSARIGPAGPLLYNSSAGSEAFVARLNGLTGQVQWARRAGGTGNDYGSRVVVNAAGEAYVLCTTNSRTLDFGPFTLNSPRPNGNFYSRAFLAKLSPAGVWQWARPAGEGDTSVESLLIDGQGDLYLSGTFQDSLAVGSTQLSSQRLPGTPYGTRGYDVFVAKTTDAGTWLWAVQGDALTHQNLIRDGGEMVADNAGHLYLTGTYASTGARFGSVFLPNSSNLEPISPIPTTPPTTNHYYSDSFLAQLNANTGGWEQVVRNGGPGVEPIGPPVVDGQGQLYVRTLFYPLTYPQMARPDWANGTWRVGPWPTHCAWDFLVDSQGRLNLMGGFVDNGPLTLGTFTLQPAGPGRTTGLIARLASSPLATRPAYTKPELSVWPNPAGSSSVWVQGPAPGQPVQVLDVLGRTITQGRMPAAGPLALPLSLPAGVYVVRAGGQARQVVVE